LQQLKGAEVRVTSTDGEFIGSILGTQNFFANGTEEPFLTLLVDGKDLKTTSMNNVMNVEFQDEYLKKDLQHLLSS
jgi:hypothetical protein